MMCKDLDDVDVLTAVQWLIHSLNKANGGVSVELLADELEEPLKLVKAKLRKLWKSGYIDGGRGGNCWLTRKGLDKIEWDDREVGA